MRDEEWRICDSRETVPLSPSGAAPGRYALAHAELC